MSKVRLRRLLSAILVASALLLAVPTAFSPALASEASPAPSAIDPSAFQSVAGQTKPSVDYVQIGLCGEIEADIASMKLANGTDAVLLGTSKGL
ncbi:MAG: hypothetical protein V2A77_09145, partial [Pseudomonadota bacterium]